MVDSSSPPRRREHIAVIGGAALVIAVTVLTRIPFLGAQELDYDEGVYWESLRALRAGHALATAVYSSQPPAFLLITEPPWALLGGSIVAARTVMLAWSLVAILSGALIGWRLAGGAAALAIGLLLAVDPLMVRQSVVLQSDGPATSLAVLAVAMAVIAVTARRGRLAGLAAAAAGAALALGVLTKLNAVAALPVLAVVLLSTTGRWRRCAAAGAGLLVATGAVLLPLRDAWQAIWDQAVGLHLASHSVALGGLSRDFWLTAARELPLILLAVAGAVIVWRRAALLVWLGAVWVLGAVAAMVATHPLWPHHLVSASPGLAVLGGAGIATALGWVSRRAGRARCLAALAAGLAAAGAVLVLGLTVLRPEPGVATLVAALGRTPATGLVVTDEPFAAAEAGRDTPPGLVDTSLTRLRGTNLSAGAIERASDTRPPVCAILLATHRLAGVPGLVRWVTAHYSQRVDLGAGRVLYTRPECPPP